MYRISVTSLEKFRRYIEGVSSYDTEEALLETLSGEFKGNAYTRIGTAFHNVVELGEEAFAGNTHADCFPVVSDNTVVLMNQEQILTAMKYRYSIRGAFFEIPLGRDFSSTPFPIYVSGRADVISGAEIRDIKTKYSTPKASDYSNSCQWKLYLDILEAERFCFDVFEFRGYSQDKCIDEEGIDDVRELKLVPFDTVVCDRYNSMEQDNRALVNEFCKYIEIKNLYHLLKQKK